MKSIRNYSFLLLNVTNCSYKIPALRMCYRFCRQKEKHAPDIKITGADTKLLEDHVHVFPASLLTDVENVRQNCTWREF
jgi:hypothetical protein